MMIIIPDYIRYTEFTLEDRLNLAHLTVARLEFRDQYMLAKAHQGRLALEKHDMKKQVAIQQTCDMFQEAIAKIEEAIFCTYKAYGRVN